MTADPESPEARPPHRTVRLNDYRLNDSTGQNSEVSFFALLDMLPAAAYTCDADGLITYFNQHAIQIWGRAPKLNDPVDRYCGSFKLYSSEGSPITHDTCWMALALKTGDEYQGREITIERADGSRVAVLAHASPIRDESGQIVGAVNVLTDVSDRRRHEEVQALLASIVESSDDAIISKTLEGRILSWNAAAERLFGYPAYEAVGAPITLIIPRDRRHEEASILAKLRRGERIEHYDTLRVTKYGRPVEISLTISPIRDSAGRIVAASKIARDITARKRSERFVEEQTHVLKMIAQREPLPAILTLLCKITEEQTAGEARASILLVDADGLHLPIGAASSLPEQFNGATEGIAIGAEADGAGACAASGEAAATPDTATDPRWAPFQSTASDLGLRANWTTPILASTGQVLGTFGTYFHDSRAPSAHERQIVGILARIAALAIERLRDEEALRRQSEKLIQSDRRKDEFLATLGHELRNPLAALRNSISILRMSDGADPTGERVYEIMERQVGHLVRLVDDLLDASRITHGKIELQKRMAELAVIVESAVEASRPFIDAARHQLAISLPQDPVSLEADPVRLSQVITNLLTNAAKYMDNGGQIWLTVRREGCEAVVSVRDTGIGIPPDMLPRVFDMFAQVDKTSGRAQGGLGIGLSLARRLVEMHGGRIEAFSEGPGQGSEFIVRLPVRPLAAHSVAAQWGATPTDRTSLPARRILVVDDTRAAVYTLGKLLEKMGQHVRAVESAEAALEAARQERPDVVISDIAMPNMSGYELARRIREEPELEDVILIALTGFGQESDRQQAKEAGFDFHLIKPVGIEALRDLLASLPAQAATSAGQ